MLTRTKLTAKHSGNSTQSVARSPEGSIALIVGENWIVEAVEIRARRKNNLFGSAIDCKFLT